MISLRIVHRVTRLRRCQKGDRLHVLGIPRVNLNEVLAIADGLPEHDEYAFGGLPYEIITVAVLEAEEEEE